MLDISGILQNPDTVSQQQTQRLSQSTLAMDAPAHDQSNQPEDVDVVVLQATHFLTQDFKRSWNKPENLPKLVKHHEFLVNEAAQIKFMIGEITKTINENLGQRQFLPDEEMKPEMRRVLQKKKEDF